MYKKIITYVNASIGPGPIESPDGTQGMGPKPSPWDHIASTDIYTYIHTYIHDIHAYDKHGICIHTSYKESYIDVYMHT